MMETLRVKKENPVTSGNKTAHSFIQPKLTINQPGDSYEREADAMAEHVMSSRAQTSQPFFRPAENSVQRKCQQCEEEDSHVHRKENSTAEVQGDNNLDNYVSTLSSSGQSLPQHSRSFFEPRFGHDFSNVRVHTDSAAAKSAQSINALAYTTGNNIVFNSGQYSPDSESGKRLMAHELTHVVQQVGSENLQRKPGPNVFRTVSHFTQCPPNANGSPADSTDEQAKVDARAQEMATTAADLTAANPVDPDTLAKFTTRFGSPPAVGTSFMNRLTGKLAKTADDALNGELNILSRRYRMVARMFSQPVAYRCIGGHSSFGGCEPPFCDDVFAWSCRGVGAIFLCPTYWTGTASTDERAAVLVHEAFHINFGTESPRQIGDVGDQELSGSGKNYLIADCYGGFAADLSGVTNPADTCPAP